ncbi:MAG: ubiquinone/menaquinone biosynthesis methyltransferase [Chloroflexota bacterium]|nr:ubiquinone/menaquinone biosynthesis methyltransferase [Chloroflexota bacterium]
MAQLQGDERRRYVAQMFTRIAGRYDLMNSVMTLGMHHRWRREVVEQATRGLEGLALDVAAGTGDLTMALGAQNGVVRAIGVDLLAVMLQRAKKKARWRSEEQVRFVVGDALHLPFPNDTFACAATAFGLRNMPDIQAALREMVRVVRPGGTIVILEIVPLDPNRRLAPLLRLYFRYFIPWLGAFIAGDKEAYTYLPASVDRFPPPDTLVGMMEEAGLGSVSYKLTGIRMIAIHHGTKLI